MPPREANEKSEAAARKAVELDDSLPEAHNTLAMLYLFSARDWRRAEAESLRTLELEPGFATGHHMRSHVLLAMNRDDEALQEEKRANEIDPFEAVVVGAFVYSSAPVRRGHQRPAIAGGSRPKRTWNAHLSIQGLLVKRHVEGIRTGTGKRTSPQRRRGPGKGGAPGV